MKRIVTCALLLALLTAGCKKDNEPGPCQDYVVMVSVVPGNPSGARCDHHEMTMTLENRVQGVLVKCTCPITPPSRPADVNQW